MSVAVCLQHATFMFQPITCAPASCFQPISYLYIVIWLLYGVLTMESRSKYLFFFSASQWVFRREYHLLGVWNLWCTFLPRFLLFCFLSQMRKAELWLVENTISKVLLWDLIIGVPRGMVADSCPRKLNLKVCELRS